MGESGGGGIIIAARWWEMGGIGTLGHTAFVRPPITGF